MANDERVVSQASPTKDAIKETKDQTILSWINENPRVAKTIAGAVLTALVATMGFLVKRNLSLSDSVSELKGTISALDSNRISEINALHREIIERQKN